MDSVKRETWERFYDRVVVRGKEWPRNLWLAAVEDGLSAALPARSRLLVQYRQDVAELRELERAGPGSYRDGTRAAQLEAQIMRLIGVADQTIREEGGGRQAAPAVPEAAPGQPRIGLPLGALALGVVVVCGATIGWTYYQQQRMAERMELELLAVQQRLVEQAADQRSALEVRMRSVDRAKEGLGAIQTELRANIDEFNQLMSASLRSLSALGDGVPASGDDALEGARQRAATLERRLDQVDGSLDLLAQRLPELDDGMSRLAERLEATATGLARVEDQVATIEAQAPEVGLWLDGQRAALEQDLEARRRTLDEIGAQLAALQDMLEGSFAQLVAFEGSLEQALARTKRQADAPAGTRDQVGAADLPVSELASRLDDRRGAQQDALQQQVDALFSELAEKADLAVLRSEDMMQRAEAEAARRLERATDEALKALSEAQAAQLAELRTWAAAAKAELGQTRAGLVAGWHGMDQAVGERQAEVLAGLDRYAATLEGRVQEFLKALDVIVARSNG